MAQGRERKPVASFRSHTRAQDLWLHGSRTAMDELPLVIVPQQQLPDCDRINTKGQSDGNDMVHKYNGTRANKVSACVAHAIESGDDMDVRQPVVSKGERAYIPDMCIDEGGPPTIGSKDAEGWAHPAGGCPAGRFGNMEQIPITVPKDDAVRKGKDLSHSSYLGQSTASRNGLRTRNWNDHDTLWAELCRPAALTLGRLLGDSPDDRHWSALQISWERLRDSSPKLWTENNSGTPSESYLFLSPPPGNPFLVRCVICVHHGIGALARLLPALPCTLR